MSIKLDWEVQSEGGWDEIGEDPQALAARRQRARRLRGILIGLLAVLVVVGAIVGYRLVATGQQARAELTAVVGAETLALRLGDYAAFSAIQIDLGTWPVAQSQAFEEYQSLAGRLEATGEIVEMEIDADRARVVLAETLDGVDYHRLWFYRRGEDGVWRHTPPDSAAWGQSDQLTTPHIDFFFYEEDAELAQTLSPLLNGWWEIACRQLACTDHPERLRVRVEPDPLLNVSSAAYDSATVLIPSPLLHRYRADGSLDPALLDGLARIVAEHWARAALGPEPDPAQVVQVADRDWLQYELSLWLRQPMDGGGQPAPLIGPLAEAYGREAVTALIGWVVAGGDVPSGLEQIAGAPAEELAVGWETYLTYRFRAEIALARDPARGEEVALLYGDPERAGPRVTVDYLVALIADPDTVQIVSLRQFDDLWWAEIHFGIPNERGDETTLRAVYEPFRQADGRWLHSIARIEDWGETLEQDGQYVTLQYYALDTSAMDGLLAEVEATHSRIAADLGLAPDTLPIRVTFVIPLGPPLPGSFGPGLLAPLTAGAQDSADVLSVSVPSPHTTIRPTGTTLIDHTRQMTAYALALEMVAHVAGSHAQRPLGFALARQEVMRLGLDPDATQYPSALNLIPDTGDIILDGALGVGTHRTPPESLEGLWLPGPDFVAYGTRDYLAADVLVDLLIETYGPETLAALAPNLSVSASLDDWLFRSLGIRASDIEAEWRARTEIAVSAIP